MKNNSNCLPKAKIALFCLLVICTLPVANAATVSVLSYGADPTGTKDSTNAFNQATQAVAAWSSALQYNILVPSGTYMINGTVFIRKGQSMFGDGHGSQINCTGAAPFANPTFVLGAGASGIDPGGSPCKIANMWTLGGSATAGVIQTTAAGFEISSMFITSSGIGIQITGGGDGLISGIQIDQSLNGISISNAGGIQITNCDLYLANYGITFNSNAHDISISNGIIEFSSYASMLFRTGQSNISAINVSNVNFLMNQQFKTFTGFVNVGSSNTDFLFTGCSFRNMYQWAINHSGGTGNILKFSDCVFDGLPAVGDFTTSTNSMGLKTVANGASIYDLEGCEFRNLSGDIVTLYSGISQLKMLGGLIQNCPQTRINVLAGEASKIRIKDVTGFPYVSSN